MDVLTVITLAAGADAGARSVQEMAPVLKKIAPIKGEGGCCVLMCKIYKMKKMKSVFGSLTIMSMCFLTVIACKKTSSDLPASPQPKPPVPVVTPSTTSSTTLILGKSILKAGERSEITAILPRGVKLGELGPIKWEVRNSAGVLQSPIKFNRFELSNGEMSMTVDWYPAASGLYTILFEAKRSNGNVIRYKQDMSITLL